MHQVIIVGAGLSGLTAAYYLHQSGIDFKILEARERIAGRVYSLPGPLEMGATWFGDQHIYLKRFLGQLGLGYFEQYTKGKIVYDVHAQSPVQYFDMPPGQAPSYRIQGGSQALLKRLSRDIDPAQISLNTQVKHIEEHGDHLALTDQDGHVHKAAQVIMTLPPQLLASSIQFIPELPAERKQLMLQTHTWMGESIKFGLTYSAPFWKAKGLSGMGFAQTGPIEEIHDHSNHENTFYALKGFLRSDLKSLSRAEREGLVKDQLLKMFGPEATKYIEYHERVWHHEAFTSVPQLSPLAPHQNNGAPALAKALMQGRLIIAGTESSAVYGGYMEGAVYTGIRAVKEVLTLATPAQSN